MCEEEDRCICVRRRIDACVWGEGYMQMCEEEDAYAYI